MIGKKINQLATELAPVSTDLTIIGDPISGVSKKITLAQLGAIFSGAVSFYTDLASFPATGDINVIYCAKDTQKLYLWSGSAYVEVFPSQALLDTYQLRSEKGNANGYASLDSGGKVPISQLPSSIMEYKGTWNAATNTPTLANGTGDTGDVYICNSPGTVNFGAGGITFAVGDYVIYSGTIWQRSSGAVGTVTSVALTVGGDAISVSGSPLTTSGTLALAFSGTTSQYIRGNGTLATFPSLTGFVPYTGATANVDLGTHTLLAAKGTFSSSGSGDTVGITHSSGSGIALNITKGGNGEGLYINKTSGSGNAATIIGTLNATTLVKSGGTSTQFLKADGSVDSNTYVTIDTFETITASKNFALGLSLGSAGGTNQASVFQNTSSLFSGSAGVNVFGFNSANNIYFGKGSDNGGVLQWSNSTVRYYTLPNATGTLALTSDLTGGTVTSVGLSSATSGVTIGSTPITTSGTITLAIATASGSQQGLLSSTDWTTFNNKQSALTNPVTGTGTTNYLPKFTGASTIGNSQIFDNGTNVGIGTASPNAKLDIGSGDIYVRTGSVTSNRFDTYNGGATQMFFGYPASGSVAFNNGSDRLILTNDGNLGLGVSPGIWGSSWRALEMKNGVSLWSYIGAGGSFPIMQLSTNATDVSGTTKYVVSSAATDYVQESGKHYWRTAPSGTAGNAISFTQAMTLDASGRLGIGTTSPGYKLQVNGGNEVGSRFIVTGTYAPIQFSGDNSTTLGGVNAYSGIVAIGRGTSTGVNPDIAINSSGNVGIGTTSPTTNLQVYQGATAGNNNVEGTIQVGGVNSTLGGAFSYAAQNSGYVNISNLNNSGGANSRISFGFGAITSGLPANNVMTINQSGNVGIGTTSPSGKLNVFGAKPSITSVEVGVVTIDDSTSYAAGVGGSLLLRGNYRGLGDQVGAAGIEASKVNSTDGDYGFNMLFYTRQNGSSLAEKMRLTSNGDLCVGTTSTSNGAIVNFYKASGSITTITGGTTSAQNHIVFANPNGNVGSIQVSGSLTTYNVTSDYRLKQDFKDYSGLELINKIKTYDYQWKTDKTRNYGVIAHELQSVINYAVTGVKDGKEMQGVDYSKIVPVLIKAIQELNDKIK
jgi:hypothetical protein